jgi:hypothetical protein
MKRADSYRERSMSELRDDATSGPSGAPTSIALATGHTVDLSFIADAQRTALMAEYMRGTVDIARKANELHVDVVTLRNTLGALAETTRRHRQLGICRMTESAMG